MRVYKATVLRFAAKEPVVTKYPLIVASSFGSAADLVEKSYPMPTWIVHALEMTGEVDTLEGCST